MLLLSLSFFGFTKAIDIEPIKTLDRLSRNKLDIKSELEYYKKNGIRIKVIDMPTTMIDLEGQEWIIEMVNNIIIEVLSSVAEQERQETRKR